ncbi:MAG: hypothetical protein GC182_03040 [Rhodopseudomonas sp.]|nr:hypothetical protein [Rhodopseudomonas sp.]
MMKRVREKFTHWQDRNRAVSTDLAAALEILDLKLIRHREALDSIANSIAAYGHADLAKQLRNEAATLTKDA